MKIYLMRHATPDWNRKDIPYHLPPGPPLTKQGELEAKQLGKYLCGEGVATLYTSPLERCQRTAAIAAEGANAQVIELPELLEWQPGEDERTLTARLWPAFELAMNIQSLGRVGLVTHGGPVAALLLALGMSPQELQAQRRFDHNNPVPPGGVWVAQRNGTQSNWRLHLDFVPGSNVQAPDHMVI